MAIHLPTRPAAASRWMATAATPAALPSQQDVDERIEHKVECDADVGYAKEGSLLIIGIGQTHGNGHLLISINKSSLIL